MIKGRGWTKALCDEKSCRPSLTFCHDEWPTLVSEMSCPNQGPGHCHGYVLTMCCKHSKYKVQNIKDLFSFSRPVFGGLFIRISDLSVVITAVN